MIKKIEKEERLGTLGSALLTLAFALILLFTTQFALIDALKGPVEAGEKPFEDLKGQYVSYEVKYPLESYMLETVTKKRNGVDMGTSKSRIGYIVYDEIRDEFFAVECPIKMEEDMDGLLEQAWETLSGEGDLVETGLMVKGTLDVLPEEDASYFNEVFIDMGGEEMDPIYVITGEKIKGEKISNIYGISAVSGVFLAFFVFLTAAAFNKRTRRSIEAYLKEHPEVTMEDLERDFEAAEYVKHLWIGKKWSFGQLSDKIAVHENSQVVWVYSRRVRNGRNSVNKLFLAFVDGTAASVSMSESKSKKAIEEYGKFPHILTEEDSLYYQQLFTDNREEFLRLKYNPAMGIQDEHPADDQGI